jgi:hypothetical protein
VRRRLAAQRATCSCIASASRRSATRTCCGCSASTPCASRNGWRSASPAASTRCGRTTTSSARCWRRWWRERLGLPGADPASIVRAQHKLLLREALAAHLPQANVRAAALPWPLGDRRCREPRALAAAVEAAGLRFPLFAKPVKGTFSALARRVVSAEQLAAHLRLPIGPTAGCWRGCSDRSSSSPRCRRPAAAVRRRPRAARGDPGRRAAQRRRLRRPGRRARARRDRRVHVSRRGPGRAPLRRLHAAVARARGRAAARRRDRRGRGARDRLRPRAVQRRAVRRPRRHDPRDRDQSARCRPVHDAVPRGARRRRRTAGAAAGARRRSGGRAARGPAGAGRGELRVPTLRRAPWSRAERRGPRLARRAASALAAVDRAVFAAALRREYRWLGSHRHAVWNHAAADFATLCHDGEEVAQRLFARGDAVVPGCAADQGA